jgi:predicted flap endonuclease-1-like 5' DNA nuclease
LLAVSAWYLLLRRRASAVRWVEPPVLPSPGVRPAGAAAEPGAPGELPPDVLATDAGLTELPGEESVDAPAGTVVVDEALVAEVLAASPDADVVVVDEPAYEEALAEATPPDHPATAAAPTDAATAAPSADAEPTDAEVAATGPAGAGPAADAVGEQDEPAASAAGGFTADADEAAGGAGAVTDADVAREVGAAANGAAPVPEPAGVDDPTDAELRAPGVDEPRMTIRARVDDEETGTRIPMPTFSEAPTMELPAVSDDLRAVRGIGPSMERMLHGLGIVSFRQLAMLDGVELERVRSELSDFRSRIEREDWVGQARELHKQKYGREA